MRKATLSINMFPGETPENINSHSKHTMAIDTMELAQATIIGLRKLGNHYFMDQWQHEQNSRRTTMVKQNVSETIRLMKQLPGLDMFIFGGIHTASLFTVSGIIDEYRFIISPPLPENGIPIINDLTHHCNLQLLKTQYNSNGSLMLCYQPTP